MKKRLLYAMLTAACMMTFAACGGNSVESEEPAIVGGWTDAYSEDIPEEAKAAFDKAYEGYEGGTVEPVAYVGSQVVAGINYKFLCNVTAEGSDTKLEYVTVYRSLQGECSFLDFEEYTK